MAITNDSDRKRILFINRFFYPDISATAQILSELVYMLAENGAAITVFTSRSAYNDKDIVFPISEKIQNVEIVRIGKNNFSRSNYLGRLVDMICFYFLLSITLFKTVKSSDTLVCKTDPPLLIVLGALIKRLKKCQLISWNQDLFPEIAKYYFHRYPLKLIYLILKLIRDASLKHCNQCVVISTAMKLKLTALGINHSTVITNWGKSFSVKQDSITTLKETWMIGDKFVVEYSGNFGYVHEYETVKKTIELLKNNSGIVFLFIGSGKYYACLQNFVRENKLGNVIFKPYQSETILAQSLSVADIHLITFRPDMEGLVFPSKFYSICSAAKPSLFIGNQAGELAQIISTNNCGQCFGIDESHRIADYLTDNCVSSEHLVSQGQNAYELYKSRYTLDIAYKKWTQLLNISSS